MTTTKHYAQILKDEFTLTGAFEADEITQEQSDALARLIAEALPSFKPCSASMDPIGFDRLGWDQVLLVKVSADLKHSNLASVIVMWNEEGNPSLVELEGKKIWWGRATLSPARVEQLQRQPGLRAA